MTIAPRHFIVLLCAAALLMLSACHQRGGFQNQDTGNQIVPLQLPFTNLPSPMIGAQVNISLNATGGSKPYVFELVQGGTSTLDPALQILPNGFIFGTASQPRNYKPIIRVTDNAGQSAQQQFNFAVSDANGVVPNIGPSIDVAPGAADSVHVANTLYTFQFSSSDADGDPITYSFASISERNNQPVTGTQPFIDATGKFEWDQMPDGIYDLQIRASDGTNVTPFFWCVTTYTPPAPAPLPCNQPPSLSVGTPPMATQGQDFKFRVSASDPENDDLVWQAIFPGAGNIANGLTVTRLAGNTSLADVEWTPTFFQNPGLYLVTLQVQDTSGNIATADMVIQLQVGPPQPSDVRVWMSGMITPAGAGHAKASDIRAVEEVDPALADQHNFTLDNTTNLDFRDFGRGASSLALTGPKHNLRIGAQRAREVKLGTVVTYIQLPTYMTRDPNQPPPALKEVSARLYHGTNQEIGSTTGTTDFIAAFNTGGYASVFEFGENIMEEIYVPFHFSELPYFVVTSDSRTKMWICRLDGGVFNGSNSNMMEFDLGNVTPDLVYHQTVTGTLDRAAAQMAAVNIDFTHLSLWFAAEENTDRLFRVAGDSTVNGTPSIAAIVNPDLAGGAAPTKYSTYFCPSGDSRRISIIGGDQMVATVGTSDDAQYLGDFRDIWMLDGEALSTVRVTNFSDATSRPTNGPDTRLIDVFDAYSAYSENFLDLNANSDVGGNDRRVIFGENESNGNSTTVGHSMNYDGTLVAFVLLESNNGNGDAGSDFIRDEVYVAGAASANIHDIIRVSAHEDAMDPYGMRLAMGSGFQANMGVCMGLSFPSLAGSKGRNNRLFFTYGMNLASSLIEQSTYIFTAEFDVNGNNDITHVSTVDRSTGMAIGLNGFEIISHDTEWRVFGGSAEGADETNDTGMYTFLYFEGTGTLNPAGQLYWLDNTQPNAAVSSTNPPALLQPFGDADGNPISVYRPKDNRTLFSSNIEQTDVWGNNASTSNRFPIHANLFADVPGPADASAVSRAFVAVETSASNETLYEFNMGVPNLSVTDLSNITNQGKIHEIIVHRDGDSVAIQTSQANFAFDTERYGSVTQQSEIFLIPDVAFALNENVAPTAKNYSASQVGTANFGGFTGRGGMWVDNSPNAQTQVREFWFGAGLASQNSTTTITTELRALRISTTKVTGMTPQVGTVSDVDGSIMAADYGMVTFYGSGNR